MINRVLPDNAHEKFEDVKGLIRSPDNDQKKKKTKGQTILHKTLCRKLNIEQHEPTKIGDEG